jgi:N-methylhydantoinase B
MTNVENGTKAEIDPIAFEVFSHRLWAVLEEGRITLQRVSASPIVSQGGECMSSYYDAEGSMVLACSGHLRFAAATSQAIRAIIEWFEDSPGIVPGDQFFFNDPYVAGSHTYDQMVIMPLYANGKRFGWTASSSHTADTGGLLRGGATEIYHEGIRYLGVKIVNAGQFQDDQYKTIVEQCRDPDYVGLDLRSRIAANNVVAQRIGDLVGRFGLDFVVRAGEKLIFDAEEQARAKLRSLPDGRWSSKLYSSGRNRETGKAAPYPVVCTITKEDDELHIDLNGSGAQMHNDQNSTLPSTLAHIAVSVTNFLFWDVPWSDGKMRPIKVDVPEGSVLNCKFPAACGGAPRVGQVLVSALSDCLAKMLYAAGKHDDVNATWQGFWYYGGPGRFYGGHDREGIPVPQGIYDDHGGGLGATPLRDGVNTGGHNNIPSGGISDVERIELHYPFLYLSRNHNPDGGGLGKYMGGAGSTRLLMVYGSEDLSVDYKPYGGIPQGAFGLFGGWPAGPGGIRAIIEPQEDLASRFGMGEYPRSPVEAVDEGWGQSWVPGETRPRVAVPEGWLIADFTQGGGGYGDPIDRDPAAVAADVSSGLVTTRTASDVFGVVIGDDGDADIPATARRRDDIRAERLGGTPEAEAGSAGEVEAVLRIHESLDVVAGDGGSRVRCRRCARDICASEENYKLHCATKDRDMQEASGRALPSGEPFIGVLREYYCPSCATLLSVDVRCPAIDEEEHWWDIRPKV